MADDYEGGTLEGGGALKDNEAVRRGTVKFSLTKQGDQLVFDMENVSGDKLVVDVNGEKCIGIWDHTIAEIVLADGLDWTLDTKAGTMSFKNPVDKRFYTIQPGGDRKFTLHARWTGKPIEDPQDHPFNLMVLLGQPGGGKPLPVTIDPDIKNPPPIRP
jgi:hypothetical protein